MRTEIIEKYIYSYEEVPEEYKEEADELLREVYQEDLDYTFSDDMYEKLQELLEIYPFMKVERKDLRFSLSFSQGDGVSFTTNNIDSYKFIKWFLDNAEKHLPDFCIEILANNIEFAIRKISYNYVHSNTVYPDVTYNRKDNNTLVNNLIDLLETTLGNAKNNICKRLEEYGYSIIEWIWEEENLKEYAQSYEFHLLEEKLIIKYKD